MNVAKNLKYIGSGLFMLAIYLGIVSGIVYGLFYILTHPRVFYAIVAVILAVVIINLAWIIGADIHKEWEEDTE